MICGLKFKVERFKGSEVQRFGVQRLTLNGERRTQNGEPNSSKYLSTDFQSEQIFTFFSR